jgi:outer membrane protein assembly factor BamA
MPESRVKKTEILSYEGQDVSTVELAGRPDLNVAEFMRLVAQHPGEPFSATKIDESIAALKRTAQFEDIQLDLRPEQDGVRIIFILQPAVYFGMYQFPGAELFPYARLLQVSNYSAQEPYSSTDVQRAQTSLENYLRRNGYFETQVEPEVRTDKTNGLANVNFHVTLGRLAKFGDIVIEGTTPEHTRQLQGALRSLRARMRMSAIRTGKKYSLKTLENATQYLEGRLTKQKYLGARVKLIGASYNPETNRADVTFNVQPGPIVNARVEGAHLWGWTRRKLLPIYQQSGLTPELIQEGRQNLLKHFRQKGFFDVEVDTQVEAQNGAQTILYKVMMGPRKKIDDVAFTGNQHFDEYELLENVSVQKAHFISNGRYNESSIKTLTAFYQSKGFNQVKVTPQFMTHNGDVVVTFVVNEGPQDIVESLRVDGNDTMSLDQLAPDGLRLATGQPYAQKSVDDDRNKIIAHYLETGYLTATFHATAQPLTSDPHKFQVVYAVTEGPQVRTNDVITLGRKNTQQALINKDIQTIQPGQPLTETEIFASESRLFTRGVFDWTQVNPRRDITSQEHEDVIVRVHEAKRNSITYGFGFEVTNRGGSVPTGTVAVPGLPPVGLPSTFKTSQHTFMGPRANFQYTRSNVRGKAETITIGALAGPLDRRASFVFTDPNFRWTSWTANFSATGEYNKENPIFTSRQAQFGFQLQKPLDAKKTQNLFLRYTLTQTGLTNLLIPQLVGEKDLHTRLSTLAAVYIRDTRDNPLDAHKGMYNSFEVDVNPRVIGSSTNFGKVLAQAAYYRDIKSGIVWAGSLRTGLLVPTSGAEIPLSQKFFTGGGSTLRGFPLNGAGPQTTIPACGNPDDTSTCSLIRVPTGGVQLLIVNTEFRLPVPIKKGLSFVTFYDGGNVYDPIRLRNYYGNYSNSVGMGFRYATPVGPIRVDVGRNLTPVAGIKATQIFITLGQAF